MTVFLPRQKRAADIAGKPGFSLPSVLDLSFIILPTGYFFLAFIVSDYTKNIPTGDMEDKIEASRKLKGFVDKGRMHIFNCTKAETINLPVYNKGGFINGIYAKR